MKRKFSKTNLITVGVPAHNEEDSIKRNLHSIINSDFKGLPVEVIVCLSNCTDNTERRLEEFKKINKKVKITKLKSKLVGKVSAYKAIDRASRNNIIVFLDADCGAKSDAVYKVYKTLIDSDLNTKIVSGNAIDPRYTNRHKKPTTFVESFNRVFWQHPSRNIVNGQFFAARKGVVQIVPNEVNLDDVYLTLFYWNNFKKINSARIIQGSAQSLYEIIRYQRNINAGKRQIKNLLQSIEDFEFKAAKHYGQFKVRLSDKNRFYPNISYVNLLMVKLVILIGEVWGNLSNSVWNQTKSSKDILQS